MNKEIEKAKEDLSFMNEGDYITKEMANSATILEEYIKQLEFNVKASKKEHEHDVAMIDKVKGNAVKLLKENRELKAVLDKVTNKLRKDIKEIKQEIEMILQGVEDEFTVADSLAVESQERKLKEKEKYLKIIEGEIKYDKRNKSHN